MNWSQASNTMEQRAIKTDVIASEDAYFMATHVPFANLSIRRDGNQLVDGGLLHWSEEEVYERLVYNPDNIHRLILVRGNNGTGKSHLIRWLCARYKNDAERYDESSEKIIFLRRLSNTIRGAVTQILDEGIVFDPEMRGKLEKFVSSNQALDAESFKLNIYHQFIVAVKSDSDNKSFSKGVRRDIVAFLSDSRVEQHMLRPGGPVDRCFTLLTAPTDKVLHREPAFAEDDFNLSKEAKRGIKKSGSEEAQSILDEIAEDIYVRKLVKYLNGFTPAVIQGCAEISSEGTKEIFLQLRRELKRQGKNLTIFIEDFTAFTGMDSELITVLASEHGGENSDLCRVTSIIGITERYYKNFVGNFTDRVQYQVFVNSDSFGTQDFLVEMTARYLNAIYCDPKHIEDWYNNGAVSSLLPISGFSPNYPWDSIDIAGKSFTLYPLNKKAIVSLYNGLNSSGDETGKYQKTPRMFLLHVIQEQMARFFDGMLYQEWNFPSEECIDCPIQLVDAAQDSVIDGMEHLSKEDRRRVKILLQFWGNSTATNADKTIGDVPKQFFEDVALGKFAGLDGSSDDNGSGNSGAGGNGGNSGSNVIIDGADAKKTKELQDRISDLSNWMASGTALNFSADYRKWLKEFLLESINWQADGVPAYIVTKRMSPVSAVYIDGQRESTSKEKAIIVLERNRADKDLLTALVYRHYSKSWGFKSGLYFQLRTVSWLEKNRAQIIAKVTQNIDYSINSPAVEWGVAVEYLQAAILGMKMPFDDRLLLAKAMMINKNENPIKPIRSSGNKAWQDAIRYLNTKESTYLECHEILKEVLRTHMGKVDVQQKSIGFFRSRELLDVIDNYAKHRWKIETVSVGGNSTGVYLIASYLNELLGKIKAATDEEDRVAVGVITRLEGHLGEINEDNILQVLTSISIMFDVFGNNHLPVDGNLRKTFDGDTAVKAKTIVGTYAQIKAAMEEGDPVNKIALYAGDPLSVLVEFAKDLDEIEKLVTTTTNSVNKEKQKLLGGKDITAIVQKGRMSLKKAKDAIDRLEVVSNASR